MYDVNVLGVFWLKRASVLPPYPVVKTEIQNKCYRNSWTSYGVNLLLSLMEGVY